MTVELEGLTLQNNLNQKDLTPVDFSKNHLL